MSIQENHLRHWIQYFYGYGSWNAKVWFVGFEESGGDTPDEVAEKINYFYKTHRALKEPTLCNLRDLYQHVSSRLDGPRAGSFTTLYDYRFGKNAIQHGVWKNLIAFEHGYRGKDLPDLLAYQKKSFVTVSDQEAWLQFYPLPSPHNHAWYYSWLNMPKFPFLKSRTQYQEHLYSSRVRSILKNITVHQPEVVLMYGMENINTLKKSVLEFFPTTKFKTVKAVKLKTPQHHKSDLNGTQLLITTQIPTLRHNRVETGFDWHELGRSL